MAEEQQKKKISGLTPLEVISGTEKIPVAVGLVSTQSVTINVLREYFRDSAMVIFGEIDDVESPTVSDAEYADEANNTKTIVYLTSRKIFAERIEVKDSLMVYYTTNFNRWQDFLAVTNGVKAVRTDKVYFNVADKELYTFNGSLHNLFDTVRINAMTEEELENLENPIEGAFYATYEED